MKVGKVCELDINKYQKFGADVFGPFLFAYSHWMYKNIVEANIIKVFCLSRDGYMMKKSLEIMDEYHQKGLDIKYIYCSRKSLRQALICNASNYEESLKYLTFRKIVTVGIILEFYGFSDEEIINLSKVEEIKTDREIKFEKIKYDKEMKRIYEKYKNTINSRSEEQAALLLLYLNQMEFSGKVVIADIGWHGSMQYYLEQFCREHQINVSIMGLYIGNHSFFETKGEKRGFLFHDDDLELRTSLLCFFGVLEKLFQSTEGSTEGYSLRGIEVEPVLSEYEYLEDNNIVFATKTFQASALEYVRNNVGITVNDYHNLVNKLLHFGKYPRMKDVKLFSFFYNKEGEKEYFTSQKPLWNYSVKELKHSLLFSAWKTGFIKSLLWIPFPYYWIYKMVA